MILTRRSLLSILAAAAALGLSAPRTASAEFLVGLTTQNTVVRFDSAAPGSILSSASITGLTAGDTLLGIDFRPATNVLYGASLNRVYTINPLSGVATLASTLSTAATGTAFGLDFNPVPDRMRLVSNTGQNLRINVDTGAVTVDGSINPAGVTIVGSAYINNFSGATSTTLYGIALGPDRLVIQNPPNNGTIVDVGPLGLPSGISSLVGFDVSGATGIAYAAFSSPTGGPSTLYTINLATGAATSLGTIGGGLALAGLAAPVPEPTALALTGIGLAGIFGYNRRRRSRA